MWYKDVTLWYECRCIVQSSGRWTVLIVASVGYWNQSKLSLKLPNSIQAKLRKKINIESHWLWHCVVIESREQICVWSSCSVILCILKLLSSVNIMKTLQRNCSVGRQGVDSFYLLVVTRRQFASRPVRGCNLLVKKLPPQVSSP